MSERSKKRKAKLKRKQDWLRAKAARAAHLYEQGAGCDCRGCASLDALRVRAACLLAAESGPDVETAYVNVEAGGNSISFQLWRSGAELLADFVTGLGAARLPAPAGEITLMFCGTTPTPRDAEIMAVQAQREVLKLWAASPLRKDG